MKKSPYFGAIVGRVANRIAQRDVQARRQEVQARTPTTRPTTCTAARRAGTRSIWTAEPKETATGPSLKLTHVSPDGEEGYPGTVTATAIYTLTNDNELEVEMSATTDKTTLVNMAHHSYWNLAGFGSGTILDQELTIPADKYTPGDPGARRQDRSRSRARPSTSPPPSRSASDLKAAGGKPVGFDHNWVVNGDPHAMRLMAQAQGSRSRGA